MTFQQKTPDANGDLLGGWNEPGLTIWAQVVARLGSEPVMQSRLQGVQPVEITVRATTATRFITTAWRAVWNGVPFNLKAVAPDPRRAFITILAHADQSDE